ncbi:MAG: peptidylprolyl isomerase [Lachnospiraceae bacterium]|nr:peptidylprolyl isomerase [Lachnospiraceae bacterium]
MNKVLAVVDGKEITDNDLNRIVERYPTEKKIYFETMQGREHLLEQKVAFTILGKYATENNIDKSEAFINKIKDISEQILTQMVMEELFHEINVTEEQVKEYFENNQEKFMQEETVNVKHILIEEETQAEEVLQKIKNGELEFEKAAELYSICPSKERGGELGYFKRGMMVKEFEEAAFQLPLNEISSLVKTQYGYHILIVIDKTPRKLMDFEEVKENLTAQLKAEQQQKIYEKKINELKEKYGVVVFEKEQ